MATVHKLAGGLLVSISTLATEFGMGRDTVSKRLERSGVAPADTHRGSPVFRLRDAVKAILGITGQASLDAGADPAKLPPQERLSWFRSETERLKVEVEKGQLVQSADCEAQFAAIIKRSVQMLATMPDRLERECGLSPEVVEQIVIACDQARAEYHAELLQ